MSTPQKVAVGRRYRRAVRVVPRFLALVVLAYAVALVAYFGKYRVRPRHHHAPDLRGAPRGRDRGELGAEAPVLGRAAAVRRGGGGGRRGRRENAAHGRTPAVVVVIRRRRRGRRRTRRLDVLVGRLRLRRRPPDARADQARPLPRPLARSPRRGSRPPGPQRHGRASSSPPAPPRRTPTPPTSPRTSSTTTSTATASRASTSCSWCTRAARWFPRRDRFPERRPRARNRSSTRSGRARRCSSAPSRTGRRNTTSRRSQTTATGSSSRTSTNTSPCPGERPSRASSERWTRWGTPSCTGRGSTASSPKTAPCDRRRRILLRRRASSSSSSSSSSLASAFPLQCQIRACGDPHHVDFASARESGAAGSDGQSRRGPDEAAERKLAPLRAPRLAPLLHARRRHGQQAEGVPPAQGAVPHLGRANAAGFRAGRRGHRGEARGGPREGAYPVPLKVHHYQWRDAAARALGTARRSRRVPPVGAGELRRGGARAARERGGG